MVGKPSNEWVIQVATGKRGYTTKRRVREDGNAVRVFRETRVATGARKRLLAPNGRVVEEYTGPVSSRR
jgi:hypothetical protein